MEGISTDDYIVWSIIEEPEQSERFCYRWDLAAGHDGKGLIKNGPKIDSEITHSNNTNNTIFK
ncbi:MAG: hypothetical protein CL609_02035 [Anaerolineaceae bacterium]|nr:hypothetical protein [Anaerolineaceae bacterium]